MKSQAKVGGILTIISGAIGALGFIWMLVYAFYVHGLIFGPSDIAATYNPQNNAWYLLSKYISLVIGVESGVLGGFAIAGGINALKKRRWGWSLAGAICSILTFFPCGIPATIFISQAKEEFEVVEDSG